MKIGFIDYYLDEFHANHYGENLGKLSNGELEVAYAYAEIDSPNNGGLTTDEWCKKYGVKRVDSIEELTALSDGIIVLSPSFCERHEHLCKIPLASGKPCYVDKTFAPDKATAVRIFENAEKHNTPCYSSSALRYASEYKDIDKSLIEAISAWGPAYGPDRGYEVYSIHQLEPLMMLMDCAATKVMMTFSGENYYTLNILFEDGRSAVMSGYAKGSPFMMNIASSPKSYIVKVESDYFALFMEELVRFFKTKEARVSHETTINIIAVREAGLRAYKTPGVWVDVD